MAMIPRRKKATKERVYGLSNLEALDMYLRIQREKRHVMTKGEVKRRLMRDLGITAK